MTQQERKYNAALLKLERILHSDPPPTTERDTAADQHCRAIDRLHEQYAQRVIRTLLNGVEVIGVYDGDVKVNEYHGKL